MFLNLFKKKTAAQTHEYAETSSFIDTIDIKIDAETNQKPSLEYIRTIFLNLFTKRPHKEDDSFPGYFQYEFEIIHLPTFFREVVADDLLMPAPSELKLSMLKVSELKQILAENGLKKTGNKLDLIQRILENVNISKISLTQEPYYSLSPKGELYIEAHKDYIWLRQHSEWGISFWEYQNVKDSSGNLLAFNDIILCILNKKVKLIAKSRYSMSPYEYSRLCELYFSIYLLFNANKNQKSALHSLLSAILLSVSGCENFWLIDYKHNLKLKNTQLLPYYKPIHIDAHIGSCLRNLQEYYNMDIAQNVYSSFIGPYNLCTFKMFCSIINEIFSVSMLDLTNYDTIIKQLFFQKLK